jgi:hypothetical protein
MKKIIPASLIIAIILALSACGGGGGVSGSYHPATEERITFSEGLPTEYVTSIEFMSSGKAQIHTVMASGSGYDYGDATYKISESSITLSADWNTSDHREKTYSYREDGDSMYLNDIEYSK